MQLKKATTTKKAGVCYDWAQKNCKFGDRCRFTHNCSSCGVRGEQKHDREKCAVKATLVPKKPKK